MSAKRQYQEYAYQKALEVGLPDPDAFVRQIHAESAFNPNADSGKALGIAQFTKSTGAKYGLITDEDRLDPLKSLDASALHMKDLVDEFGGDQVLAAAAYNAGPQAVKDHDNQVPPYKETQNYVNKIFGHGIVNVATSDTGGLELRKLSAQDWAKANGLEIPPESIPQNQEVKPLNKLTMDDWARANGQVKQINDAPTGNGLINAPAPTPENGVQPPINLDNLPVQPMAQPPSSVDKTVDEVISKPPVDVQKQTTVSVGGPQTSNPALEELATGKPIPPKKEMTTVEKVPYWANETMAGLLDLPPMAAHYLYNRAADLTMGRAQEGQESYIPYTPVTSAIHDVWQKQGLDLNQLQPSGFGEEALKLGTGMMVPMGQYGGLKSIYNVSKSQAAWELAKQAAMAGASGLAGATAGRLAENTSPAIQTVATGVGAMLPPLLGSTVSGLSRSITSRLNKPTQAEKQTLAALIGSNKPGEGFLDAIPLSGGKETRAVTQDQFNTAIQQFRTEHPDIHFTLPEIIQAPRFSKILNTHLEIGKEQAKFTPASFNTMAAQYHWLMQHPQGEIAANAVGDAATKVQEVNREAVAQRLTGKPYETLEEMPSGLTASAEAQTVLHQAASDRLNGIIEKLNKNVDEIGLNKSPGTIGDAQRSAFLQAEQDSIAARNKLFDAYKEQSKAPIILDTANIKNKIGELKDELFSTQVEAEARKAEVLPATWNLFEKIKKYTTPGGVNPATGQPIMRSLTADEAIALEKQTNNILYDKEAAPIDKKIAGNIKAGIRGDLVNPDNPNIPEQFKQQYLNAIAKANEHHKLFDTALEAKITDKKLPHEYTMSEEKIPAETLASAKNVRAYTQAVGEEQAIKDLGDAYASNLHDTGIFNAEGTSIKPNKITDYINKTADQVRAMPGELRSKIATLNGTGETLKEQLKEMGSDKIKSLFNADPLTFVEGKIIKQMLSGGVTKTDIEKISNVSGVSLPEVKKLIREGFAHQIAKPFEDGDNLSKLQMLTGLKRNEESLSFVLGSNERGKAVLKELNSLFKAQRRLQSFDTKTATGLGIGSQTATRMSRGIKPPGEGVSPRVVEGILYWGGFYTGGVPGLAMGVGARLLRGVGPNLQNEVEKRVVEALFDPAVYVKLTSNSKAAEKIMVERIKAQLEPTLTGSALRGAARHLAVPRAQAVADEEARTGQ